MPKAIGSLLALLALGAGMLNAVDSMTCLWRAALAFFAGWIGALVWQAVYFATARNPANGIAVGVENGGRTEGTAPPTTATTG